MPDRLCITCNYWTATVGDQCEACATTTLIPAETVAEYVRLTDEDAAGVERPSLSFEEVVEMLEDRSS